MRSFRSIVALRLFRRFDLSIAAAGTLLFWSGRLSGLLGRAPLGRVRAALRGAGDRPRVGLDRTMVFTHLSANALLVAAR